MGWCLSHPLLPLRVIPSLFIKHQHVHLLQACDQAFAAEWLQHHVMQGLGSNNSSSMAWMHAGACCQLVQESALLQRLVSTAPQLMPANQAQLQECWTQLCLTAQQVCEDNRNSLQAGLLWGQPAPFRFLVTLPAEW